MKSRIEYTNLSPTLNSKEVKAIIDLAACRGYRAVVLTYNQTGLARSYIQKKGYSLKVVTVFGFPFDNYAESILTMYRDQYDELDVVIPTNLYYRDKPLIKKVEHFLVEVKNQVSSDIIINSAGDRKSKVIKLIIETALMKDKPKQIKELCILAKKAGIDVIKTSTGLVKPPQRKFEDLVEEIKLIKKYWSKKIKASGGIRTLEQAKQLIEVGADFIGTSSDMCKEPPDATS